MDAPRRTLPDTISHARVWGIAAPLMASNVAVPLLGIVDTAVVGQLPGAQNIGAVAVGSLVINLIYWSFGFLRMGTSGFSAQAFGSDNDAELRATIGRGFLLAGVIGIAIVVLQAPIVWASLALVGPSDDVSGLAETYLSIRLWGAPAMLAIYAVHGWLLGLQRTRAVLFLQVFLNGMNIVLDLAFVLGFGWGVEGVAIATVISEVSAAGLGLFLVRRQAAGLGGSWDWAAIRAADGLKRLIGVNRDLFLRTACLQAASVAFTAVGARLGDDVLAANAVLLLFFSFMSYALDGLADAANTLCGESYGARNRARFWDAVRKTTLWSAAFAAVFTAVFAAAGTQIIAWISVDAVVRETAGVYLPYVVALPLITVWSFELDGVFIGMTRGRDLRNAMIVTIAAFALMAWIAVPAYGNAGLWAAFLGFQIVRAAALGARLPGLDRLFVTPKS
jgi:MATE family multidrug resistance protein